MPDLLEGPRTICACCQRSTAACEGCGKLFLRSPTPTNTTRLCFCAECDPWGWGVVDDPFEEAQKGPSQGEGREVRRGGLSEQDRD